MSGLKKKTMTTLVMKRHSPSKTISGQTTLPLSPLLISFASLSNGSSQQMRRVDGRKTFSIHL